MAMIIVQHFFFRLTHRVVWHRIFDLHKQEENPCPPVITATVSQTVSSLFNKFSSFVKNVSHFFKQSPPYHSLIIQYLVPSFYSLFIFSITKHIIFGGFVGPLSTFGTAITLQSLISRSGIVPWLVYKRVF